MQTTGVTFTTTIDVIEWMGSELDVHFSVEAAKAADLQDLAEDLGVVEMGGDGGVQMVARLDVGSDAAEGKEVTLWLDAERIHLFDPETGENLQADIEQTAGAGT